MEISSLSLGERAGVRGFSHRDTAATPGAEMANALPDLKLLRIFVSVVRHQGFANAQQELNVDPAISTYMSQLETASVWCCAIVDAADSA